MRMMASRALGLDLYVVLDSKDVAGLRVDGAILGQCRKVIYGY